MDITIDNLHSDKETLKRCSLVCRDWVPSSSLHLLRRVAWPMPVHGRQVCDHFELLWATQNQHCSCPDPSDASFSTCVDILTSSSRLRHHVRELALTSQRQECFRIPGEHVELEELDVPTLMAIINLLPGLGCLHLERCALRPEARSPDVASSAQSASFALTGESSCDLNELTFRDLADKASVEAMADVLSHFQRIGKLTISGISRWHRDNLRPLSFSLPPAAPVVETLIFDNVDEGEVVTALCRELRAHAGSAAVRHVVVDRLTLELLDFVCAAPNLESLSYVARGFTPPVVAGRHHANLRRVTFIVPLWLRPKSGSYASPLRCLTAHIQILSVFNASEVAIGFSLSIDDTPEGDPTFDANTAAECALGQVGPELQAIGEALESYGSLRALVLEVRNFTPAQNRFCVACLRDAAARHLPRKYARMLRIESVKEY